MVNPTGTDPLEPTLGPSDGTGAVSNNGHTPKSSTRKPASRKPKPSDLPRADGTKRPHRKKPQAEDILDQPDAGYLSEEEIDVLLEDLPPADDTPIPQEQPDEPFTSGAILLTLLDGIVQMAIGPQYAMTKDERKLIGEPLDRILSRFPAAQIAQYGAFVDPVLLLMGLISWGSRITRMKDEEKKKLASGKATPHSEPPSPKPAPSTPIPEHAPNPLVDLNDLGSMTAVPPFISHNMGSV